MPLSSNAPTLAHPLRKLKLLVGQWLTPACLALMSSISAASRCTPCARMVLYLRSPYASYTPAYVPLALLMTTSSGPSGGGGRVLTLNSCFVRAISAAFSDMCVWIARVRSEHTSSPSSIIRSFVHEMAKRGVRMGWTRGGLLAGLEGGSERMCWMTARVAVMDSAVDGSM